MKKDDELNAYLREAQDWDDDRVEAAERSERKAWNVAKAAIGLAGLAWLAVAGLTPLKEVKTETLLMDKSTGNIEQLQTLREAVVGIDEIFIKSALSRFIRAREGYSPDNAVQEENYYEAAAFLCPQLQSEWGALWKPENPQNPIKQYRDAKVKVEIPSIVPNKRDDGSYGSATIRFNKTLIRNGIKEAPMYYITTVPLQFVQPSKDEAERRRNPLGMQMCEYRVDPEVGGAAGKGQP